MKIELKRISFNERMSEETNCFSADLYIDGKKVGSCKNDGRGGCTNYGGNSTADYDIIKEAEAYCKTLPKVKSSFDNFEFEQSLESVIDELLEEYLKAKEKSKVQKLMEKAILWGVPDSGRYTMIKYNIPLSHVANVRLKKLQETVDAIKIKHCAGNVQILNTNLEALGIVL
jgi:copper chaperone CopZ